MLRLILNLCLGIDLGRPHLHKSGENYGQCSSRQGHHPAVASPAVPIARFRHVAIPQLMVVNRMDFIRAVYQLNEVEGEKGCHRHIVTEEKELQYTESVKVFI